MSRKTINVNGFEVGGKKSFLIADIGSNHKQDLALAKESIDAAAEAGADAIKFQSIQLDDLYYKPDATTAAFIKKLEFPEEWHGILNEYCKERNILFFSSPTYSRAVDLLEEIDVPLYKLASAQIGTFPQVVEKVAQLNKPTIFSTGISTYEEIIKAVRIFQKFDNDKFMILHCNSIYPVPPERVNMNLMQTYQQMFGNPTGFSDHSVGIHIPTAAVVMGASIIEKHFTLDRNLDTPDSNEFAADPAEFKKLVTNIRDVEAAISGNTNRLDIQDEEVKFKNSILYRLVATENIQKGALITKDKVVFRRDEKGIDCRDFYQSKTTFTANRDIAKGMLIEKNMLA